MHAALCDHVGRHRAVNAAGEERHRGAAASDRETARTVDGHSVYISRKVAHLNVDYKLRVMHVDLDILISVAQGVADILAQLDARHREGLVTSARLDLEALRAQHILAQILNGELCYRVLVLFAGGSARQAYYAEHLFECLERGVHIGPILALDIDYRLQTVNTELPYRCKAAADIRRQLLFEASAVKPLEDYLAQFEQNYIVHLYISLVFRQ